MESKAKEPQSEGMDGGVDEDEFLKEARERFSEALSVDRDNREQALDDLQFLAGEQWPEDVKDARSTAGRPCLTINRLPQFVSQIEGDIRLNRPSIRVRPVEDADDDVADVYEGLIRSIEDHSDATGAYASAAVSAAQCGLGHFRLKLENASDETFDIDIRIRRIKNPLSVVWDPASDDPTQEDARYCFVIDKMSRDKFEEKYPDHAVDETFSEAFGDEHWNYEDSVTIAEYWTSEIEMRRLVMVPNPMAPDDPSQFQTYEATPEQYAQLEAQNLVVASRMVPRRRVQMYLTTGKAILSGPHAWPGKRIPIFSVWGREIQVGERTMRKGLITDAKDSQRLFNYMRSASAEMLALAPKAPWLVTDKNVEGREDEWAEANTANAPYLTVTPDPRMPSLPRREAPPPVQAALLQESALASDDMKSTTGIYDAALGARSNETSGVAIRQRQQESDVGAYVFQDNLRRAVRACGGEIVALIPTIYDAPRTIRILGADEAPKIAKVNQSGGVDLTRGKFDVTVEAGPAFSTKRQEAAELLTQVVQSNGDAFLMFGDIWARNLDIPGSDELRERLEMLVAQRMQSGQPDPQQQQVQMAMLQQQFARGQAEIEKLAAEVQKIRAQTAEAAVDARGGEIENQLRERAVVDPRAYGADVNV
jgi:hypothetical protein